MSADFFAGYASGALGIIIGNPLDLIKVRLQAAASTTSSTSPPSTNPHTIREALRGLPAPVLTYGALNALLFTSYNRSLAFLSPSTSQHGVTDPRPPYASHFLAGAIAGLATFVISTPTELVKCRAQAVSDPASARSGPNPASSSVSSWAIAKQTFRHAGIAGLYEGGMVTGLRDAVGYGFYFWTYEACKDLWDDRVGVRSASKVGAGGGSASASASADAFMSDEAVKVLLCGGVAGVATWASIFPLDVIKTRVQTQVEAVAPLTGRTASSSTVITTAESAPLVSSLGASAFNRQQKKGAVTIAREAYRSEGISVFFRGITVCCIRAFLVNSTQWLCYEYIMRLANAT